MLLPFQLLRLCSSRCCLSLPRLLRPSVFSRGRKNVPQIPPLYIFTRHKAGPNQSLFAKKVAGCQSSYFSSSSRRRFFLLNSKTFCEEAIQQIRSSPSLFSLRFCCFFSFLIFLLSGYSRFGVFLLLGGGEFANSHFGFCGFGFLFFPSFVDLRNLGRPVVGGGESCEV
jgi:hypothetical protein